MEELTCDLFAPGMTPLHRAGLGGLASTLYWLTKQTQEANRPPGNWSLTKRSITFRWEGQAEAHALFAGLFSFAFQLKDGLIYFPGQYGELPPPQEVLAALHEGLLLSFYDHKPTSIEKAGEFRPASYEIDDAVVTYKYQPLSWYKHQGEGLDLFLKTLQGKGNLSLTRTLFPGAIERHVGVKGTQVTQPARLALPLLFAPIGTIALKAGGRRVNDRGKRKLKPGAALLIPDLHTLEAAEHILPTLAPKNARDCQVTNSADATLQAELRLRSRDLLAPEMIPAIRCVWCCPTDWNSRLQPPSLVTEVQINTSDPKLDQFEIAMKALPILSPKKNEKKGEYFWPRSHVRPFVAENLAAGRPWYSGFNRLMTAQDPMSGNKPIRDYLNLERSGLHIMTQEIQWDHPGEETIVRAVHEALRCRYGRIASENTQNPVAMKKRMTREYERLRLAFVGAKTPDGLRYALTDLWSRAGSNSVLKEAWPRVLPMLANEKWQLTRDLALLALASYQGKGQEDIDLTSANEDLEESEGMEE